MKHLVKRAGHTEPFEGRKLYASIYAACQSVREPVGSAELIAERVLKDVTTWLEDKKEVTSNDIREIASIHLKGYNPDAGYMYRHHRIIW
jgi:transcriptional regulator NrdR family protein